MAFDTWEKLLYGIGRGECIVFLGPDLPLMTAEGEQVSPARRLAESLLSQLDPSYPAEPTPDQLAEIAQHFLNEKDEIDFELALIRWHQELDGLRSQLHDDLAALPFTRIITSSHDPLMETALRNAGKPPAVERYHYRGRNKELLAEPTSKAPLLFHLYGSLRDGESDSVVLAETQLLDFLTNLSAKNPPLPRDVDAALATGRCFLFLGFGLHQWYLRVLLHVLKVLRPKNSSFAVEPVARSKDPSLAGTILFYQENFKVGVYHQDPLAFVRELRARFVESAPPSVEASDLPVATAATVPAPEGPTVFICHASENKDTAKEIYDALERAGMQPWLDSKILNGGDPWDSLIEAAIEKTHYFLVLNSRELDRKSRQLEGAYVNKEIKVAQRTEDYRRGVFIIPVRLDDSPLFPGLESFHAVDLTQPEGMRNLVRAIKRDLEAQR